MNAWYAMKNQIELNKALLDAVSDCNYEKAEQFLKVGADPLGSADESEPEEHLLGELFCEMQDNDALAAEFPRFLQLFYAYGMDIAARKILTDDGDNINPLWDLAFCQTEDGLKVLYTMLEHGLDCDSAEALIDHIYIDTELCDGCHMEDPWWLEQTVCGFKMIMLIASYPDILDNSAYIRSCVEPEKNNRQNLPLFREWNHFNYHIDLSTCTNLPHGLQNATVTISHRETGKVMWKLSV